MCPSPRPRKVRPGRPGGGGQAWTRGRASAPRGGPDRQPGGGPGGPGGPRAPLSNYLHLPLGADILGSGGSVTSTRGAPRLPSGRPATPPPGVPPLAARPAPPSPARVPGPALEPSAARWVPSWVRADAGGGVASGHRPPCRLRAAGPGASASRPGRRPPGSFGFAVRRAAAPGRRRPPGGPREQPGSAEAMASCEGAGSRSSPEASGGL